MKKRVSSSAMGLNISKYHICIIDLPAKKPVLWIIKQYTNQTQALMKKSLTLMLMAAVLFLGACKKSESTEETPATGANSWTLAGITYKTSLSYRAVTSQGPTLLNFYDATPSNTVKVNALAFSFITLPTASGTYHLVSVGAAKTPDQFELSAGTTTGAAYAYVNVTSPTASIDIAITVTSGKIKIVLPEITLKSAVSGNADAKITASVTEI